MDFENKWNDNEIKFLVDNYEKIGPKQCSEKINRTIRGCQLKANRLGLKFNNLKSHYEKNNLENYVKNANSYAGCLKIMGLSNRPGNYDTLKKYIKIYEIDISHFYSDPLGGLEKYRNFSKISMDKILIENSTFSRNSLKKRLYEEGYKERKCEKCGQDENWRGEKISLILDHVNGINDDNRIENLRILCPNCNATLETHCSKNK